MRRSSSSANSATPLRRWSSSSTPTRAASRRATRLPDAWSEALACDSVSAFGGIVATNRPLDAATAEAITQIFTEVVVAPDADEDARAIFARKKNLRLLLTGGLPDPARGGQALAVIAGGLLVQDRDNGMVTPRPAQMRHQTPADRAGIADCLFAWTVAKHVKSNAIVYAKDGVTAGIGAGQMNRRDCARIAAAKASEAAETHGWAEPRTVGSAVASDAFFPFADGLLAAAEAGATAVIQPGGSIRDDEVIAAADEAGSRCCSPGCGTSGIDPRSGATQTIVADLIASQSCRLGAMQFLHLVLSHAEQLTVLGPEALGPQDRAEGGEDRRNADDQLQHGWQEQPRGNAHRHACSRSPRRCSSAIPKPVRRASA